MGRTEIVERKKTRKAEHDCVEIGLKNWVKKTSRLKPRSFISIGTNYAANGKTSAIKCMCMCVCVFVSVCVCACVCV